MTTPYPDLKVNGLDGEWIVLVGDEQMILFHHLLPGDALTGDVDWWLMAIAQDGQNYYFNFDSRDWINSERTAYEISPLHEFTGQNVRAYTDELKPGLYQIYGGVDTVPNGVFDGLKYLDHVELEILP